MSTALIGRRVGRSSVTSLRTCKRSAHTHRTVTVQLKADIPGLGLFGSVHEVAPGRMRNYLKPRNLALYVLRGTGPILMSRPVETRRTEVTKYLEPTLIPGINIEHLRQRLAGLPPLIFPRRVRSDALVGGTQPIYGSVSVSDVTKHLQDVHSMNLVPPDAVVSFKGRATKLKSIGSWTAEVRLKTGEIVPLVIQIEKQAEIDS